MKIFNKERKNIYRIALVIGAVVLFYLLYIFPSNKFKLIVIGSSLIILAIIELLGTKNKYILLSYFISGIIALLVALLSPEYIINLFLLLFYLGFLIVIIFLLNIYVKVGDSFNNKEKTLQLIFRVLYFILSIILSYFVFKLIDSIIPHYFFAEKISWTYYILFVIILFTSLSSFYLLIDNIIRIIITIKGKSEIFAKINYSAYHSFFLSLALLIIVGGYYYINNQNNEIFTKLMIIIGLAFVTSLIISVNLKNLLGKDKEIKSS